MGQALKGKDLVMFVEKDGLMTPICCSRELSISVNGEVIEATKMPQSKWRSYFSGLLSYSISTSGLVTVDEGVSVDDMYGFMFSRTPINFIARYKLGVEFFVSGTVILTSVEVTGSNKDVVQMSVSGTGDGELSTDKELQTFPLTDGEGNIITDGAGNTILAAPDQYGTDVPIDISVDC